MRNSALPPAIRLDVAWRTVALIVTLAAGVAGLVIVRQQDTTSIQSSAATVWMSGESRGRVVLASARGERPSLAIEIGDEATAYDLADLGTSLLVHDRTSGAIVELDGRDGREQSRVDGPQPADQRPALVSAGAVAYVVDVAAATVQRLTDDLTRGDAVPITGGFTDWVGTPDGLLWLVDDSEGVYLRFDGGSLDTVRFADQGASLDLTAIGDEPVVYDASTGRVRWLRQASSTSVPGREPGEPVLVQEPDSAVGCLTVLAGSTLSCIGDAGVVREVQLGVPVDASAGQLFANSTHVVVAGAGSPAVQSVAWVDGSVTSHTRREPSGRSLVGSSATGALTIDDPGSRYSFSVDRGAFVELDKFSRRTIVIASDGSSPDGVGSFDEDADVEGVITDGGAAAADLDDNGVNDPPQPRDDRAVTRVGRAVSIGVLANDVDPDGDPLTVVDVEQLDPADGVVTILEGSRINYQPAPTAGERTISFVYTVADPGNLTGRATVTVEVIGGNRNTDPRLADDRAVTQVNTAIDIDVLANDSDDEGDPLAIVELSAPANGAAAIESSGTVRYEPEPGFIGNDSFTYTVQDGIIGPDGSTGESTATVEVEVVEPAAANRPPVAVDDRASASGGVRQRIDVLGNDSDPDGDTIRIVAVSSLPNVDIVIVGDQAIDVEPASGTAGLLTFTYTISDPEGLQDTATVALVIAAPEPLQPPIAIDDSAVSASVAIPIDVVANDVDPNNGQLVVESWSQPAQGQGSVARISPTTLRYTPPAGYLGTTRFAYRVQNVAGLTASATVSVTVIRGTGSGPVARPDSAVIFPGDVAVIFPLSNDTHPDGLPFDYAGPPTVRSGTATVNPDRSITFTPPSAQPAVYVLTYSIQDQFLARSSSTITISVVARPVVNRPPTAQNDLVVTTFNTPVTANVLENDSDPDDDLIRLVRVGTPTAGTAVITAGRIRYTPPPTFAGLASVTYTIADDRGLESTATLTVQVAERVQVAPLTTPDLITIVTGTTGTIDPVANDVDPDGLPGQLRLVDIGATPSGAFTATIVTAGVRIVAGTTPGSYPLAYTVADADGLTARGTITVVVQAPPNAPPVAVNDSVSGEAVTTIIRVLDNDLDPDGGTLTLASLSPLSPAAAGSISIVGSTVVYTPSSSFAGVASFTYTVRDAQGADASATVTLTIVACPVVPTLAPISVTTRFATPATIVLFPTGAPPARTSVTLGTASAGSAVLGETRASAIYTPPAGFNGTATFAYRVTTSCGATATAVVTVVVNRAPVAVDDTATTSRNTSVTVPVLANDTDPDGDTLVVAAVTAGTGGTPTLRAGVVTFTPISGFAGTATFTYTVRDIGGLTATGNVSVAVANAAPIARPDVFALSTLTAATAANVLANDTDPNGDVLTIVRFTPPVPAGVVTVSNTGAAILVSTLPASEPATVTMEYTISDGLLEATTTLTINVTNRAPVANPDVGAIDLFDQTSVTVNVLANDTDLDGGSAALTIVAASVPAAQGSVSQTGGSLVFTPSGTLTAPGTVIVTYTIQDAFGARSSSTLTITVISSPPPTTTTPPPPTTTSPPPTTTAAPGVVDPLPEP